MSSITLTWDGVDEANRYQVTYRQAGTGWTTATLPTNATSYTLTNLEPGTEYSIRIRSLCSDQLSSWTRTYVASTTSMKGDLSAPVEGERTVVTLSVYPNPNSGQFNVRMRAETARTAQMIMMDLSGRVILNVFYDLNAGENEIPVVLDGVASGLYTLRVLSEGTDLYKKIVVN